MNTTVFRRIVMFVGLAFACTTSGCSQVSFDAKTGFSMAYPTKGENVSTAVETMLNRFYDPRLSANGVDDITAPIRFKVSDATVISVDQVTPRPDYFADTFIVHCHLVMTFASGQSIECDDEEKFGGTWQGGKLQHVGIKFMSDNPWAWMSRPDVFSPSFLANVKALVSAAASEQDDLRDDGTIVPLMRSLIGKDMSAPLDLSSWLAAHQLARENNGVFLPKPSGDAKAASPPAMAAASSTASPEPPAAPAVDPMAIPSGEWIDITLAPVPGGTFHIPIHDPKWRTVKNALPRFEFDARAWTLILQNSSHNEAEKQLLSNIQDSYSRAQAQVRAANQPEMDRLAQAAYLAQQSNSSWAQKRAYENMAAAEGPKLEKSTRFLEAVHIVIVALQDDIRASSPSPAPANNP